MSEKTINFGDKKINKKDFYNNKKQFTIEDIDINKILISKPERYENNMRKYIIGYNDNTISPLQLFLPKMTGYLNIFKDGARKMSFFTDNNELLERYTAIWEKINDLVNKKFDSDTIYNNKYTNTKIRSYNNDIKTNFRNIDNKNNKLPEKNKPYKCVSLISLDSIIKINKKYQQTLLQECVYKHINKEVENIIININLDSSSESGNELDYE